MDEEYLKELKQKVKKYVDFDHEVSNYRSQFFAISWSNEPLKKAPKALTIEEMKKLTVMEEQLDRLRKEYLDLLTKGGEIYE
ncbi:hypothetical protein KKA01_00770 [Patescibacteria group bacterium]|nr:hypothetical protein [Patescibacteria group bacterium]